MSHRARILFVCLLLMVCAGAGPQAAWGQAQSNAGDLVGAVSDPQGARVSGATVTVRNRATNLTRITSTNQEGEYRLLVLPPGEYEVTVEAVGFANVQNPSIAVQIGQRAQYDVELPLRTGQETITVTTETQLVDTQRTTVAEVITPRQIEGLPINQRDYLNFTLLNSQVNFDSAPSIGAAPSSGLNFGGQRARSNQVSVDGADYTDNSINGVRATVSQEAVQEFQIATNSYLPEFGRASGGVVNIVTKGGSNDLHGNVFGFLRHQSFQARNPFSTESNPAFTRVEAGFTVGGPIVQDRTFFFASYELRHREETGFSSIGADNFGLVPFTTILGDVLVTPEQLAFFNDPLASVVFGPINFLDGFPNSNLERYLFLAAGGSGVALNGINPFLAATPFGASFPSTCVPPVCTTLPTSFVQLNALRGNYPIGEETHFLSARIDHRWTTNNNLFIRGSVTPSDLTGIQVNAQNQTFGQNSFSRSSDQSFRDWSIVAQNVTTGGIWVNEFRFQFGRRGLSYTPSGAPGRPGEPLGGQGLGVDIGGFAHFGREPFSRVDRVERRWQWTDNFSLLKGTHTFKFGFDFNLIQIRPRFENNQLFELNFGGTMRFSALSASTFGFPDAIPGVITVPGFSGVQAYGIGIPSSLVQGIGDSRSSFNNYPFAAYFQDSWRIHPRFTLNYGIRWDGERTPLLPAFNALTAQAEEALGVLEGIPRDWDNWAPRVGFSWDPWGDGKTAIRAAYGLFYDHPLLGIAFNSDTADGAQSTQQIIGPTGGPCFPPTSVLVNPACLNAINIFQGILDTSFLGAPDPLNFGYEPDEQRFEPFTPDSIFVNQNYCPGSDATRQCAGGFPIAVLPFTLPVARDFEYGYAQQWNLTVERELWHDFSFSVGYLGTKGSHLNRPRNITPPDTELLIANFNNALTAGLQVPGNSALGVAIPIVAPNSCVNTPGGGSVFVTIPAVFALGFNVPNCAALPFGFVAAPVAFNFFRPQGPNFAFTGGLGIPDAGILAAVQAAGYPEGPGFFIPFSDVNQQESSGSSIYHGMTVNLRKRYGNHYQFLVSYTWSHAIDDSTDLQTLLNPQDNGRPDEERSTSTFDQRHRFVASAVFDTPSGDSGWRRVFGNFTIAPIFQAASGRPFTVLTGRDSNLDFGPFTDRPSVGSSGDSGAFTSPFLEGVVFIPPDVCPSSSTAATGSQGCKGDLGRNTFTRPEIWQLDLRVARKIFLGEETNVELIADVFNLFNRFNVADVNQLCDPIGGRCIAGQPTAARDARQFQFGVKLNW